MFRHVLKPNKHVEAVSINNIVLFTNHAEYKNGFFEINCLRILLDKFIFLKSYTEYKM